MSLSQPNRDITSGPEAADLDPVQVETRIQELVGSLSNALLEWKRHFGGWKKAEREFDAAYAAAKIAVSADVPYNDRGQHATIATMKEREAKDVAEEAFKYAEQRLSAVRSALSAWQSIGKSVGEAYRNANRL